MKKVFYEAPGIEIIPMTYLEHVCQNLSGGDGKSNSVADYQMLDSDDILWD